MFIELETGEVLNTDLIEAFVPDGQVKGAYCAVSISGNRYVVVKNDWERIIHRDVNIRTIKRDKGA